MRFHILIFVACVLFAAYILLASIPTLNASIPHANLVLSELCPNPANPACPTISVIPTGGGTAVQPSLQVINCAQLFKGLSSQPGQPPIYMVNPNLVPGANPPSGFLSVSLLIILAVLTILGLVYAAGIGFQLELLMQYAKSEMFEAIVSLLLVLLVAGGIPAFDSTISTLANIGTMSVGSGANLPTLSSAYDVNVNACNFLQSGIMEAGLTNWVGLYVALLINGVTTSFTALYMPNGFGFSFAPFAGTSLIMQLLYDEQMIFFGSIMFGTFLIMLLFVIYFLFPIFFYVGIALRSFPWTRAAGGSLIALFISFWVVFPALTYSFSAVATSGNSQCPTGYTGSVQQPGQPCSISFPKFNSFFSLGTITSLFPNVFNIGGQYEANLDSFAEAISYTAVQLLGLLISLFISYEVVEKIGGVLGAPSMQSQRLFSKVL